MDEDLARELWALQDDLIRFPELYSKYGNMLKRASWHCEAYPSTTNLEKMGASVTKAQEAFLKRAEEMSASHNTDNTKGIALLAACVQRRSAAPFLEKLNNFIAQKGMSF